MENKVVGKGKSLYIKYFKKREMLSPLKLTLLSIENVNFHSENWNA